MNIGNIKNEIAELLDLHDKIFEKKRCHNSMFNEKCCHDMRVCAYGEIITIQNIQLEYNCGRRIKFENGPDWLIETSISLYMTKTNKLGEQVKIRLSIANENKAGRMHDTKEIQIFIHEYVYLDSMYEDRIAYKSMDLTTSLKSRTHIKWILFLIDVYQTENRKRIFNTRTT